MPSQEQTSPEYPYSNDYHGPYAVTGRGVNSQGNKWVNRSFANPTSQHSYRYNNTNGSWYYRNPDGSTYHDDGKGRATYTTPGGREVHYDKCANSSRIPSIREAKSPPVSTGASSSQSHGNGAASGDSFPKSNASALKITSRESGGEGCGPNGRDSNFRRPETVVTAPDRRILNPDTELEMFIRYTSEMSISFRESRSYDGSNGRHHEGRDGTD